MAKAIGSLPENVNFGIKASTVRQFLTSSGLPSKKSERTEEKSTEQLAEIAQNQALMVMCLQLQTSTLTPKSSNIPTSPPIIPTPPTTVVLEGHLQINVNASNSQISINGESKGYASPGRPLNLKNLPTGNMSVRVDAEGFDPNTNENCWEDACLAFGGDDFAELLIVGSLLPKIISGGDLRVSITGTQISLSVTEV